MSKFLDFDNKDGLKLVQDAYSHAEDAQRARNNQYKRDYELYRGMLDMSTRDPNQANLFIPKIYNIVETKAPKDVTALLGTRPYVPFDSRRPEFKPMAQIQNDLIDHYLEQASFYMKTVLMVKLKTLYGTAFMDQIPYYKQTTQKSIVPQVIYGQPVGLTVQEDEVVRLCLMAKVWAPWEVFVDPYATNLEERDGCRYLIKFQLVSRRQILELAQGGAYPGFDLEKFMAQAGDSGYTRGNHEGLKILADFGLSVPRQDSDIGILMRYESPDRYIDIWNGDVLLRDIDNPFKHKRINMARAIHQHDSHTQNQFWGVGEAKPNEVLQAMLNDLNNMTFNAHNLSGQPVIFVRKNTVNRNALVWSMGNRIEVDSQGDQPLKNLVQVEYGQALPPDHYLLSEKVERFMDQTSGVYSINRGEPSRDQQTATEVAMLRETGDTRQGLNVKLMENVFLSNFGRLVMDTIDQFAMPDDIVEAVGEQKAAQLLMTNPADLPGGFNFTFKGSDRVMNQLTKQRNMSELDERLAQNPTVRPDWRAKKLLEAFDLDEKEIAEAIIPMEVLMAQQAMQGEQQFERDREMAQAKGGDRKENNPSQMALESGRDASSAARR